MGLRKTACNELNFKEVHEVPPPINLDVTPHEKPSQDEEKLPSIAIKLIRRLLNLADADYANISFKDRDMLEDALSGISLDDIARRKKLSRERTRQRVKSAFDLLTRKIEEWEELPKKMAEMDERMNKQDLEMTSLNKQAEELAQSVATYKTENEHLRSIVKAYSEKRPKLPPELKMVNESTRMLLCSDLKTIGVSPTVAVSFAAHNIHTVSDIIRYTDHQLAELDGVSDDAIATVKEILKRYDLDLGSDIRLISIENDYYIYPSNQ